MTDLLRGNTGDRLLDEMTRLSELREALQALLDQWRKDRSIQHDPSKLEWVIHRLPTQYVNRDTWWGRISLAIWGPPEPDLTLHRAIIQRADRYRAESERTIQEIEPALWKWKAQVEDLVRIGSDDLVLTQPKCDRFWQLYEMGQARLNSIRQAYAELANARAILGWMERTYGLTVGSLAH